MTHDLPKIYTQYDTLFFEFRIVWCMMYVCVAEVIIFKLFSMRNFILANHFNTGHWLTRAHCESYWFDTHVRNNFRIMNILWDLIHWGQRVTHTCVSKIDQHWLSQWLVASSAPNHYLNQCWFIVNWNLNNKPQLNSTRNSNIIIQEDAFQTVVRKLAAILSRPQCINLIILSYVVLAH